MTYLIDIAREAWEVLAQMGPYLLFGFFVAGILSVCVSPEWVERHLGGRGLGPVVKSALFGVPLPLCSCGVIPVAASIRGHGASKGATVSFLLSTPQTGVDSILATYAMLGPIYAIFRPVVALITGVVGGALVDWLDGDSETPPEETAEAKDACCSDGCGKIEHKGNRVTDALRYGFVTLPRDIARALLIGVLIAALISAFIDEGAMAPYLGGGLFAMFMMMIIGIPIYVCATASIPVAVGLMHMGASPGAALVFLIAGPATNAAAIGVVWKVLGRRTAIIYLSVVALGALFSGILLDLIFTQLAIAGHDEALHAGHESVGLFGHISAVALLVMLVGSFIWGKRHADAAPDTDEADKLTETLTFHIDGMRCTHCTNAVLRALQESPGVHEAHVDLDKKQATVTGDKLDGETIIKKIVDLGYVASLE